MKKLKCLLKVEILWSRLYVRVDLVYTWLSFWNKIVCEFIATIYELSEHVYMEYTWIYRNLTIKNGYIFFKLWVFEIFLKRTTKNTSMQAPKPEQALVLYVNRLKTSVRTYFSCGA